VKLVENKKMQFIECSSCCEQWSPYQRFTALNIVLMSSGSHIAVPEYQQMSDVGDSR